MTAAVHFEAVLNTAAMDEAARNAWCCEHASSADVPGAMD
jgi:hypothetical protein